MDHKRLLTAFILSAVILFGWSYLFPPSSPPPRTQNSDSNSQNGKLNSSNIQSTESQQGTEGVVGIESEDKTIQSIVRVSSPLYEVKLDSRGAVATSWVIKRNKEADGEGKPIFSISSNEGDRQPLQLISQIGIERGLSPLKIVTGNNDLDNILGGRNYSIAGRHGDSNIINIELKSGAKEVIEFQMQEATTGLDVIKRLTFDADQYFVKVETKITRGGQPFDNAKMLIGPNIGDQGVKSYTFYSVAPEGIAAVGDSMRRLYASDISQSKESPNFRSIDGQTHWAGVGDTYFAMSLVLSKPANGLEFRTEKYKHQIDGNNEDRYLITAYVPVHSDGSPAFLYAGPKDHDQLQEVSLQLSNLVGRTIDLENLIDYGWTGRITRPLTAPILWSIKQLNRLTGSYGVAIILFTVIIYTLFFPLKWRSSKSMKKAQKLAPRMKELQEKMKGLKQNDPKLKELQMEQLRLMKEGNPLGGCLPLLIQMPFLIALYIAITISIDFRQASFLWIPDLSASEPYPIHILPILMAASMLVLQLITPAPSADPLQRKMMAVIMPLMMLYILWSAPAGLLVYWLVGNLVGFGQQVIINRMLKSEDDEPPEASKMGVGLRQKSEARRVSQAN